MKRHRPLLIALAIAAAVTIASVCWEWYGEQAVAPPTLPAPGAAEMDRPETNPSRGSGVWRVPDSVSDEDRFLAERQRMVEQQLAARDIADRRVLAALLQVPRHEFVPASERDYAYRDGPLPIGQGQTISQPYIVALMTQLACPSPQAVALDVGTGSGYQAAVLARLCRHVYSIEIVESLADAARQRLDRLGYDNVTVRAGDGYAGWPAHSPFDLIIVAAAPDHVPQPLVDQLKPGGRLVIPVGRHSQDLMVISKSDDGKVQQQQVIPVVFVPMTGAGVNRSSLERGLRD
jgi:protein-L-isoaspartate(D-aspartate) O-methyltransferase